MYDVNIRNINEMIGTLLIIILILTLLALLLKLIDLIISREAPFVSSPKQLYPEMCDTLEIKPGQKIYDLGCGKGSFLKYCAQKHSKAFFIGVEKGIIPYLMAKASTFRYKNIKIYYKDLNKTKVSKGSKVFVYLFPSSVTKLLNRMPKDSYLFSLNFSAKGKRASREIKLKNPTSIARNIYVYNT